MVWFEFLFAVLLFVWVLLDYVPVCWYDSMVSVGCWRDLASDSLIVFVWLVVAVYVVLIVLV